MCITSGSILYALVAVAGAVRSSKMQELAEQSSTMQEHADADLGLASDSNNTEGNGNVCICDLLRIMLCLFCPNCSQRMSCPFHGASPRIDASSEELHVLGAELLGSLNYPSGNSPTLLQCRKPSILDDSDWPTPGCKSEVNLVARTQGVNDGDEASTELCGSELVCSCTESDVASEAPSVVSAPNSTAGKFTAYGGHQLPSDESAVPTQLHRAHFHGAVANSQRKERQRRDVKNTEHARLYIGNLPDTIRKSDLHGMFGRFGKLMHVHLPLDRETFEPRGFAFVAYFSHDEAQKAIDGLDGCGIDHNIIRVRWASAGNV